MNNLAKRLLCLALGAMLATGAGCQKKPVDTPSDTSTPAAPDKSGTENTLPIVKDGSVTLSVGTQDNGYAAASYTQNLPVWKAIEEKTGVKIKWDVIPSAQYSQTMQVRLAAMNGIPDIISLPSGDPVKFGQDGVIIPIEKLIDQYASNMKKFYNDNPNLYKLAKAPDGHIYAISSVMSGTSLADPMGYLIRKDWLDKLGLKEPTTTDEWYNVLKAFKEKDPNGNGKADEIPLSFSGWSVSMGFGDAWGQHLFFSKGFKPDKNGKLEYEWIDSTTKEFLAWMNKLYKEGLIDPDYLTQSAADQLLKKVTQDTVGATRWYVNRLDTYDSAQKKAGHTQVNWIALPTPAGPNGYKGHTEKAGPISGFYGITSTCKNQEIAIKWLDYVYASEEGYLFTNFGIEGKSYTMENGEPKFSEWTTKNPDGLDMSSALRSLGAMPSMPWIRNDKGAFSKQPPQTINHLPKTKEAVSKIVPTLIDSLPVSSILATPEEASRVNSIMADLQTKQDEWVAKFITGTEDINSKWDKYVKDLQLAGLDELMKIRQQQYERYIK